MKLIMRHEGREGVQHQRLYFQHGREFSASICFYVKENVKEDDVLDTSCICRQILTVSAWASSFLRGTFNIFMHERFKSLCILKAPWALSHFKLSVFSLRCRRWDVYDSLWDSFSQTSLCDLKLKHVATHLQDLRGQLNLSDAGRRNR